MLLKSFTLVLGLFLALPFIISAPLINFDANSPNFTRKFLLDNLNRFFNNSKPLNMNQLKIDESELASRSFNPTAVSSIFGLEGLDTECQKYILQFLTVNELFNLSFVSSNLYFRTTEVIAHHLESIHPHFLFENNWINFLMLSFFNENFPALNNGPKDFNLHLQDQVELKTGKLLADKYFNEEDALISV